MAKTSHRGALKNLCIHSGDMCKNGIASISFGLKLSCLHLQYHVSDEIPNKYHGLERTGKRNRDTEIAIVGLDCEMVRKSHGTPHML